MSLGPMRLQSSHSCILILIFMEKPILPISSGNEPVRRRWPNYFLAVMAIAYFLYSSFSPSISTFSDDSLCPIVDKIDPRPYVYDYDKISSILLDKAYIKECVDRWAGSIQIPSVSTDVMINPNVTDDMEELYKLEPLWKEFTKLHGFLEKSYPLIHKHLKVEKVNKFSLLVTWQGSKPEKKPILLTAHQDVVPVPEETVDQWKYPPFSGAVDGDRIYGRGASDCKDLMMALFETIELLLKEGKFQPERTILLGFGYDEESQGTGANELAQFILKRYGPESLYALIDEGSSGYQKVSDRYFVPVLTGEKGHLNSEIQLFTPGGHSSVPPKHTAIGIMSKLIDRIESVDFVPILTNANPTLNNLQCLAEHTKIDTSLKSDIIKAQFDPTANKRLIEYLSSNIQTEYLIKTSQAADIIQGGIKSNSLPDHVSVLVNHRIAAEESVFSTGEKILGDIKHIASKFDLGIIYKNQTIVEPTEKGHFVYNLLDSLEPSPVSPIGSRAWNTFGGSLRYFYEDILNPGCNQTFIIAPEFGIGNTDTKSYWDLTADIYRYAAGTEGDEESSHVHSIGESASIKSHMATISFYYYFLQVVDQAPDS